jgi:predicted Zn-dependent protease
MDEPSKGKGQGRSSLWRLWRAFRGLFRRDGREHAWAILDLMDARPRLRRALVFGVPAALLALAAAVWGYEDWERANAVRIARQWLDADRLDRAADAVQDALAGSPNLPVSWRLASELAWRKGNRTQAIEYAKRAAAVGHDRPDDVLTWAETAVLAGDSQQAEEALGHLDADHRRESPRALRLAGEIARRAGRFAEARDSFQAALVADTRAEAPILASDEVPLGIVCLRTGSAVDLASGRALLRRWVTNPDWGAEALRALLADAQERGDREGASRWAQSLRMHPRCTLGDIPFCLKAVAENDPARYQAMLAPIEEGSRLSPTGAAQLLGWLAEIGRGDDAVRWGRSLPPGMLRQSSVVVGIAEALRSSGRWKELGDWVDTHEFRSDVEFLGWAYGMIAARHLGDDAKADELWRSLYSDGVRNPAHALFAGNSLYAWGYPKESEQALLLAADRPDLAYEALGTLVRLYQVRGDAVCECKAFGRLNLIRSSNRDIANNYAYFAALTDLGSQGRINRIAEDNFNHDPDNPVYRSTFAFVLVWSGEAPRALSLMEKVSGDWRKSPAVAFAYGAALAGCGRKDEARTVFASLDPRHLGPAETEWIRSALR